VHVLAMDLPQAIPQAVHLLAGARQRRQRRHGTVAAVEAHA